MSDFKVDINLVKELRATTGVGLSDCRDALVETNNDFDKALELLKVKGLSKAMSKSNIVTTEGATKILVADNKAVILELNCQTDFVANNSEFNNVLNIICSALLNSNASTLEQALEVAVDDSKTIKDVILSAITKLQENIVLKRFQIINKEDEDIFGSYTHTGGVASGIVVLSQTKDQEVAKNIAMQLVAMKAKFIDVSEIDESVKEKEITIAKEQVKNINKPQEIIEKMIQGKVNKALAELTIVNQAFIKEPSLTIKQYLEKNHAIIKSMVRYQVGELI